jgi:putative polyketide hydroxylase
LGSRVSTIDLIGKRFTVLGSGPAWREAVAGLATAIPLDVFTIGDELADVDGQWHATYGVEPGGAVLVRPDGYIAWRARGTAADAARALRNALSSVVGQGA